MNKMTHEKLEQKIKPYNSNIAYVYSNTMGHSMTYSSPLSSHFNTEYRNVLLRNHFVSQVLNRKDRVIANEPIESLKKVHLHEIRKKSFYGLWHYFSRKKVLDVARHLRYDKSIYSM